MAYTTREDVKGYLGIASTITTDDSKIDAFVSAAQKWIDTFCRRSFEASVDTTRRFHAIEDVSDDGMTLFLDADLCQITSVVNGDGVTVSSGAYVTQPVNFGPYYALKLKSSGNSIWTYNTDPEAAITVTGRWAYAVTAPVDIQHAAKRLAAWFYEQRDNFDKVVTATSTSSGALKIPMGMPDDVGEILTRYRRVQP